MKDIGGKIQENKKKWVSTRKHDVRTSKREINHNKGGIDTFIPPKNILQLLGMLR